MIIIETTLCLLAHPFAFLYSHSAAPTRCTPLTLLRLKQLQVLSLVCFEYNFQHYWKIPNFMTDFADENCHDLLTNLAPNDDEIFDMFFWKKNNNTYISHTFTEVGLCYTFNLMSRERIFRDDVNYTIVPNGNIRNLTEYDWSPEKGFKKTDKINGYPLRTVVGGTKNTLELGLTTHPKDYDFLCEGPFQGYNVSEFIGKLLCPATDT